MVRFKGQTDETCLNAVNDGLDVIRFCIQLSLADFCSPGSNAAAHVPNGLRPHCNRLPQTARGGGKYHTQITPAW